MSEDVDVYRIARLMIEEHGVFAEDEVQEKIEKFLSSGDCTATHTWYEIEAALKDIRKLSAQAKETEPA